jgi:HEAT repeat protein
MESEGVGHLTQLPGGYADRWVASVRRLHPLAQSTSEPGFWLAKLRDLERWVDYPADIAARLIDLLVTSKRDSLVGFDAMIAALEAGHEPPNPRAMMLQDELVCTASNALIQLGAPAREALLRAYAAAAPGAKERCWFLITLSRMGDQALESFFDSLTPDQFDAGEMHDPVRSFQNTFEFYCAMNSFRVASVEAIYAAVHHRRRGWREAAVQKLSGIGDERAIQTLRSLLNDPDEAIRSSVRYNLAWIEQKRAQGSSGVESD